MAERQQAGLAEQQVEGDGKQCEAQQLGQEDRVDREGCECQQQEEGGKRRPGGKDTWHG
ncbi:hypothetical protein D3C87_1985780 [compost metagenome]